MSDSHFKEFSVLPADSHLASFAYFIAPPAVPQIDWANSSRITKSTVGPVLFIDANYSQGLRDFGFLIFTLRLKNLEDDTDSFSPLGKEK